MARYTCLACSVVFYDGEMQRFHYKTDWHRYNLKRKIAELPPVTEEEFQKKVEFQAKKKEEKHQDNSGFCKPCNKSFSSTNAYENHIKSKRHKDLLVKYERKATLPGPDQSTKTKTGDKKVLHVKPKAGYIPPVIDDVIDDNSDDWEDISDDEEMTESDDGDTEISEALPPMFCLFCPHESVNIENNLRHMTKSHSFFIPDIDFVTDLELFLVYLGAKVGDGKICLKCNTHSKQFRTLYACQNHMIDKGHCMLDTSGDSMLEYAEFYDFSSTYPGPLNEEDIDEEISLDESALQVDPETMELILPSGARAGHRALKKYYNQNILGRENQENKTRAIIAGVNSQYKALGYHGTTLSMIVRKNIEAKKTGNMKNSKNRLTLGVKNNKQKHFRKQQMYCG